MITIEAAKKEGYTDTLKMKGLMPGKEYVIMSLSKRYDEPLSGESQYGTWYLYNMDIHEYKTFDMGKEKFVTEVFDEPREAGYFCGGDSGMYRKISSTAPGQKFKVTMEEMDNGKTKYVTEDIVSDNSQQSTTVSTESSEGDEIADFIKSKVLVLGPEDMAIMAATKYGKTVDEIKATYGGLLK